MNKLYPNAPNAPADGIVEEILPFGGFDPYQIHLSYVHEPMHWALWERQRYG